MLEFSEIRTPISSCTLLPIQTKEPNKNNNINITFYYLTGRYFRGKIFSRNKFSRCMPFRERPFLYFSRVLIFANLSQNWRKKRGKKSDFSQISILSNFRGYIFSRKWRFFAKSAKIYTREN